MHELRSPVSLRIQATTPEECDAIHDALEKALQRVIDEGGTLSDWPDASVKILYGSQHQPRRQRHVWLVATMVECAFGASLHRTKAVADSEVTTFNRTYDVDGDHTWAHREKIMLPEDLRF